MKLSENLRNKLNVLCSKYCGWFTPMEFNNIWDKLLDDYDISVFITDYPIISADGTKSYNLAFMFNDEVCKNSRLILTVYEGPENSNRNEYNIYFS